MNEIKCKPERIQVYFHCPQFDAHESPDQEADAIEAQHHWHQGGQGPGPVGGGQ